MASPRKVEYIRRRKTHNQGYNYRCPTFQYYDSSPITSEEGGWINPNPIIVKPKSPKRPKEFDNWPKLDPKGKWNADLTWGGPDDSEWY